MFQIFAKVTPHLFLSKFLPFMFSISDASTRDGGGSRNLLRSFEVDVKGNTMMVLVFSCGPRSFGRNLREKVVGILCKG